MSEPRVDVLRLGHRKGRDPRITTHLALVARAFGANRFLLSGDKDQEMFDNLKSVDERFGRGLECQHVSSPIGWLRKFVENDAPMVVDADDFIKKSGGFSIKVLIERIRVQLRKKTNTIDDTKNIISHGRLKLDPAQLECEWNGKALPDKLTTTEFLIVKELAKRPGVIKERAHLMDIAYKENTEIEDRTTFPKFFFTGHPNCLE